MPWLENHRDWPRAMSAWDTDRLARHAAHTARFVDAGWRPDTASLNAFDLVMAEDEAEKAEATAKKKTRIKQGATA